MILTSCDESKQMVDGEKCTMRLYFGTQNGVYLVVRKQCPMKKIENAIECAIEDEVGHVVNCNRLRRGRSFLIHIYGAARTKQWRLVRLSI